MDWKLIDCKYDDYGNNYVYNMLILLYDFGLGVSFYRKFILLVNFICNDGIIKYYKY